MTFESYANGWPDLKKLDDLAQQVAAMPTFTSTDKAALEEFIENEQAIIAAASLATDVEELQTTVGDNSAGLVKDVDDLQTTVGDATAGLVKDVDDLEAAISYSNNEIVIGKWTDGSTLYRKVISLGEVSNSTSKNVSSGLTDITVRRLYGAAYTASYARAIPYFNKSGDTISFVTLEYIITTNNILVHNYLTTFSDGNIYAVLEYTKNPPAPEPNTRNNDTEPNEKEDNNHGL